MNMNKQVVAWKLHYCNLSMWVNNNQLVDLIQNQIVQHIIYHNKIVVLEILALHTRCWKGLLAYVESDGIIAMKKHVELEHNGLFKRYVEKVNNCPKASSVHEPTIKSLHATPSANSIFFLLLTNSKEKNYETHVALSKDVMLYVIEGSLQ